MTNNKIKNGSSYCYFKTAWGHCSIHWTDERVVGLTLPTKNKKSMLATIASKYKDATFKEPNGLILSYIEEIQKYFLNKEYDFSKIKISLKNSPIFYKKVYKKLMKVKRGQTISYKTLSELASCINGARAVGQAVKRNPIPLLIPCHRVINSDTTIGAFSGLGGVRTKIKMLELEKVRIIKQKIPRLALPLNFSEIKISEALSYLIKSDIALGRSIKKIGNFALKVNKFQTPFIALLEAIVYQQLTGKAASTIFQRLLKIFGRNGVIRPFDIIRAEDSEIKAAGLSTNKTIAIKDLAEKALSGEIPTMSKLTKMQNEEIIYRLSQIKGIGRWTVEMFLIFRLGRADILAKDDYGLQKGLAIAYNLTQIPKPGNLEKIGLKWKPYRSIASWYLWQLANNA